MSEILTDVSVLPDESARQESHGQSCKDNSDERTCSHSDRTIDTTPDKILPDFPTLSVPMTTMFASMFPETRRWLQLHVRGKLRLHSLLKRSPGGGAQPDTTTTTKTTIKAMIIPSIMMTYQWHVAQGERTDESTTWP